MNVKVFDAVKIPENEWDRTPPEQRGYVEQYRKNGFVYGINKDQVENQSVKDEDGGLEGELYKLGKKIEQAYRDYQVLQDMYRYYTGKEHEWLK